MFYHKSYKHIRRAKVRRTKVRALCTHLVVLGALFGVLFGVNAFVANAQTTRNDTPTLPSTLYNYANPNLPDHFNDNDIENLDNTPRGNPVTDAGATLGRVLFYETNLSIDRTVSCGSCHFQENGFADPAQFSEGVNGLTGRNSMGLANNRYYRNGRYFWDERAANLETQVLMPIQDQVEMGLPFNQIVPRIQEKDYYGPLFTAAFGDPTINTDRVSRAMAQFIRSMVSYESRLDQALGTRRLQGLTELEREGRRIFNGRGRCDDCHREDIQVARQTHNNGLDAVLTDLGEGAVTGNNNDNGKFKVPSLRNIAETGPYMHDGRFDTLEEVVNFYNNQVQRSPNLDNDLSRNNGRPRRLGLDRNERAALVAFMRTFSDQSFLTDPKFSDPFAGSENVLVQVEPTQVPIATPTSAPMSPSVASPLASMPEGNRVYVSSTSGGNVGGVSFDDEDILAYDISTGTWSMVFDGSDVGIGQSNVDAFTVVDSDSILLSLDRPLNMSAQGLGTVDDSDILAFTGSFGADTSGTWRLYFDGSDVGLNRDAEDVDAVALDTNGNLLLSMTGVTSFLGMTGGREPRGEDVLRFTATSLGHNTSGSWSSYFDGSDMDLDRGDEDIWGIGVNTNTDAIYLTTRGNFNAQGDSNRLTGDVADIFMCTPSNIGNNTDCVLSAFWHGDDNGFGNERLDAVAIDPTSVLVVQSMGFAVRSPVAVVLEED
ncbi:MAG: cytochrome c peroxidase [Chloroflexota bacterium]